MPEEKSVLESALPKAIGLVVFLIMLGILNLVQGSGPVYNEVVGFFNSKVLIIIAFAIFLILGELLFLFDFPLSLAAPILNAMGGVILVDFVFDIIVETGDLFYLNFSLFRAFELVVLFVVLMVSLIVGYIKVLSNIVVKKREEKKKIKQEEERKGWYAIENRIQRAFYPPRKFNDKPRPRTRPVNRKRVSRKK
jgi:hypothetical protein